MKGTLRKLFYKPSVSIAALEVCWQRFGEKSLQMDRKPATHPDTLLISVSAD